jgi:hypothetical protein
VLRYRGDLLTFSHFSRNLTESLKPARLDCTPGNYLPLSKGIHIEGSIIFVSCGDFSVSGFSSSWAARSRPSIFFILKQPLKLLTKRFTSIAIPVENTKSY